jgi:hypothetical protein
MASKVAPLLLDGGRIVYSLFKILDAKLHANSIHSIFKTFGAFMILINFAIFFKTPSYCII